MSWKHHLFCPQIPSFAGKKTSVQVTVINPEVVDLFGTTCGAEEFEFYKINEFLT
jgi:hypothetical protein